MTVQTPNFGTRIKDVALRLFDGAPKALQASPSQALAEPAGKGESAAPPRCVFTLNEFTITGIRNQDELVDFRLVVFAYVPASDPAHQPVERLLGVYEARNVYIERESKTGKPIAPVVADQAFPFDVDLVELRFVMDIKSVETGSMGWNGSDYTNWRPTQIRREVDSLPVGAHSFTLGQADAIDAHEHTGRTDGSYRLTFTVERLPGAKAA